MSSLTGSVQGRCTAQSQSSYHFGIGGPDLRVFITAHACTEIWPPFGSLIMHHDGEH